MWVVKGGMVVELRLGDSARMTKDLFLNFRTKTERATEAHEHLLAALSTDPTGDGFLIAVSQPTGLPSAGSCARLPISRSGLTRRAGS